MANFPKLAATAKRLVEKNGRDVTLYRRERDPGTPAEPWRGPGAAPPEAILGPVKVAFVPPSGGGMGELLGQIEATLAQRIDQVGLLAANSVEDASPVEPDVTKYDTLVDGNTTFNILTVSTLRPAEKILLYVLALEG